MSISREPHCKQTSRSVQASTVVSAPCRRACPAGSGSTLVLAGFAPDDQPQLGFRSLTRWRSRSVSSIFESLLTILHIDMIGYNLLISLIMAEHRQMTIRQGTAYPTVSECTGEIMPETDCEVVVAEFIRTKGITRCPTACRPTAWLPQPTGPCWKSTQPFATDRGKHEPLLVGGRFGMSRPHCRGKYNPLRVHDSATAEWNLWSVLRPLPQL
jgi:hypothetical protein